MVVAIIATVAVLLLPILSRARTTALTAHCLNNMKQLQMSYQMYVSDNRGFLPWNNVDNPPENWVLGHAQTDANTANIRKSTLFPYNNRVKIYTCPSTPMVRTVGVTLNDQGQVLKPGSLVPQTRTYSIEYSMGGNAQPGVSPPWQISRGGITWNSYSKASQVLNPRQKLVFVEESEYSLDDGEFALYPLIGGQLQPSGSPTWWNMPANRHNYGCTFSFFDGHVEYHRWVGPIVNQPQYQIGNGSQGDVIDNQAVDPDLVWIEPGGVQGL